jgi:hypothetical protein
LHWSQIVVNEVVKFISRLDSAPRTFVLAELLQVLIVSDKHRYNTIGPNVVLLFVSMEPSDGKAWTGLIWLRIGTGGGIL